ncbi:hypothetical protein Peur_063124 [Populus x canadensis]
MAGNLGKEDPSSVQDVQDPSITGSGHKRPRGSVQPSSSRAGKKTKREIDRDYRERTKKKVEKLKAETEELKESKFRLKDKHLLWKSKYLLWKSIWRKLAKNIPNRRSSYSVKVILYMN